MDAPLFQMTATERRTKEQFSVSADEVLHRLQQCGTYLLSFAPHWHQTDAVVALLLSLFLSPFCCLACCNEVKILVFCSVQRNVRISKVLSILYNQQYVLYVHALFNDKFTLILRIYTNNQKNMRIFNLLSILYNQVYEGAIMNTKRSFLITIFINIWTYVYRKLNPKNVPHLTLAKQNKL